jgi:L-ascorbate metabolism protein UlaG (beta-lactamase superfamily)
MQIIFIHHSCFVAEIDDKVLIFDYFGGDRVNGYHFSGKIPDYAPDTKIYVFSSHKHQDHFDMDILRWSMNYPNIRYILSKDIRISPNFLGKHGIDPSVRKKVQFVTGGRDYEVDSLKIKTLNSTDAGVAFYVSCDGASLFHAGDLNDWKWDGVGDLINGRMRRNYRHEINKLSGLPVNAAFIPMDPRQGAYQAEGIDYFLKNTDAEYVFPMHMWQDYSGIAKYKKKISNTGMAERIIEIERENQTFLFDELS